MVGIRYTAGRTGTVGGKWSQEVCSRPRRAGWRCGDACLAPGFQALQPGERGRTLCHAPGGRKGSPALDAEISAGRAGTYTAYAFSLRSVWALRRCHHSRGLAVRIGDTPSSICPWASTACGNLRDPGSSAIDRRQLQRLSGVWRDSRERLLSLSLSLSLFRREGGPWPRLLSSPALRASSTWQAADSWRAAPRRGVCRGTSRQSMDAAKLTATQRTAGQRHR